MADLGLLSVEAYRHQSVSRVESGRGNLMLSWAFVAKSHPCGHFVMTSFLERLLRRRAALGNAVRVPGSGIALTTPLLQMFDEDYEAVLWFR